MCECVKLFPLYLKYTLLLVFSVQVDKSGLISSHLFAFFRVTYNTKTPF